MATVIDIGADNARWVGMFREGKVVQYTERMPGSSRLVRVSFPNAPVGVLIEPQTTQELDAEGATNCALAVAHAILNRLGSFDYDCAVVRAALEDKREAVARADAADRRLARVLGSKRRLSGPATVRVDAKGAAWLLADREKGWASFGYYYPDLPSLWRAEPDLRPTDFGTDEFGPWMLVEQVPVGAPSASHGAPSRSGDEAR